MVEVTGVTLDSKFCFLFLHFSLNQFNIRVFFFFFLPVFHFSLINQNGVYLFLHLSPVTVEILVIADIDDRCICMYINMMYVYAQRHKLNDCIFNVVHGVCLI